MLTFRFNKNKRHFTELEGLQLNVSHDVSYMFFTEDHITNLLALEGESLFEIRHFIENTTIALK